MKREILALLSASVLLVSPAAAGNPKIAKCGGPSRYANPYGTVLPTLPVPGGPAPPPAAAAPPATTPSTPGAPPAPAADPPPAPAPKIGALLPYYPSC